PSWATSAAPPRDRRPSARPRPPRRGRRREGRGRSVARTWSRLGLDSSCIIAAAPLPFIKHENQAGIRCMARRVVDVLVPVALDQTYSYRVPEGLELAPGDLVTVPLGPRAATGAVWAENATPNPRLDNRMKEIEGKLDLPPLKDELRRYTDWVATYTLAPRGMVLRMALRMGEH